MKRACCVKTVRTLSREFHIENRCVRGPFYWFSAPRSPPEGMLELLPLFDTCDLEGLMHSFQRVHEMNLCKGVFPPACPHVPCPRLLKVC
jgi:hypothetical protein